MHHPLCPYILRRNMYTHMYVGVVVQHVQISPTRIFPLIYKHPIKWGEKVHVHRDIIIVYLHSNGGHVEVVVVYSIA